MWNREGDAGLGECGGTGAGPASVAEEARTLPCHDPERLGALLHSLEPRLTAVALRFTRDPETAQDVVQSAFEKVVRHCDRFRGGSKASTWMHRIVTNEALMWLRSERRRSDRAVVVEDWERLAVPDPEPSAAELLDRARTSERVRRGLEALRPEEREILERCALGGRSYHQFSAESGMHPAAVKTRAFRARRRLGEILAED